MPDLKVICSRTDCVHFRRHAHDPSGAYCAHAEKAFYMRDPCALYKKGFDNSQEEALAARFKLGGVQKKKPG